MGQGADLDLHVDAVEQRAGDLVLIARHKIGRASAAVGVMTQVAAGAGVHRGNQLEPRGEICLARGAGDGDVAGL